MPKEANILISEIEEWSREQAIRFRNYVMSQPYMQGVKVDRKMMLGPIRDALKEKFVAIMEVANRIMTPTIYSEADRDLLRPLDLALRGLLDALAHNLNMKIQLIDSMLESHYGGVLP
jgi:hypothetical protein